MAKKTVKLVKSPINSGVYMLRDITTGAGYVGSSRDLKHRLKTHRSTLVSRGSQSGFCRRLCDAFPDVARVEFRILEFVEMPANVWAQTKTPWRWKDDCTAKLHGRERYWIDKLKPSLNRKMTLPEINLADLPVGPPAND